MSAGCDGTMLTIPFKSSYSKLHCLPLSPRGRPPLAQRLAQPGTANDMVPIPLLRKYIAYARQYCHPHLSDEARDVLQVCLTAILIDAQQYDLKDRLSSSDCPHHISTSCRPSTWTFVSKL